MQHQESYFVKTSAHRLQEASVRVAAGLRLEVGAPSGVPPEGGVARAGVRAGSELAPAEHPSEAPGTYTDAKISGFQDQVCRFRFGKLVDTVIIVQIQRSMVGVCSFRLLKAPGKS